MSEARDKSIDSRTKWLIALAFLSLPLYIHATHILLFVAIFNCFILQWNSWHLEKDISFSWILPFLAYFTLQFWSVFRPGNFGIALSKLETAEFFLVIPLLSLCSFNVVLKQRKFILRAYLIGLLLAMIISLTDAILLLIETRSWFRNWPDGIYREHHFFYVGLAAPLMHPSYFSALLGVGVLLSWTQKDLLSRNQTVVWSILALLFLFLLQARMSLLAFSITVGIWTIYLAIRSKKWKPFLFLVMSVIVITIAVILAPQRISDRLTKEFRLDYDIQAKSIDSFSGITIRLAEWECAMVTIKENFMWGVGNGLATSRLYEAYESKGFYVGLKHNFNCHNQFIEVLLAHGLLGLGVLLVLITSIFYRAWRYSSTSLFLVTFFLIACTLTESMWQRHLGATSFAMFSILLSIIANPKPKLHSSDLGE